MITTADTFGLEDNVKTRFDAASIYCIPTYYDDIEQTSVEVRAVEEVSAVDTRVLGTVTLEFTNAALEAFTPSGSGTVAPYYNLVEQATVDYLEGLTVNSGVTFTIT